MCSMVTRFKASRCVISRSASDCSGVGAAEVVCFRESSPTLEGGVALDPPLQPIHGGEEHDPVGIFRVLEEPAYVKQ